MNASASLLYIQLSETIDAANKKVTGAIQEEVQKSTVVSTEGTPPPALCRYVETCISHTNNVLNCH